MPVSSDLEPRTYFRTLDAAMADFELPLGAVDRARLAVRGLDFEHVYIPESRAYIALEAHGRTSPVAYVMPHYVALHPADAPSEFVEIAEPEELRLPDAAPAATTTPRAVAPQRARASAVQDTQAVTKAERLAAQRARATEPVATPCPTCFTHLPATGLCDWCG
ncbi:hypothetical protein [Demequina activiva]|uniref:hypothetical protein n=1 Tax=Demequina activiva TaxID=1582364 RepID=UPI001942CF29|nr:hypothetical protein [Demequina activiva]